MRKVLLLASVLLMGAAWAIAQDAYRKQTGGDLLEALRAGKTQEVQKALRDSQQWTTANLGGYAANLQKYGTPPATEDRPVTIAGQNGKLYPLTKAESDQYYSIKEPGEAQHFLEGTAKAPQGIPESPLAGQVARIQASNATPEAKEAAIAELHRQHTISTMGQDEAKYELTRGIVRGDPRCRRRCGSASTRWSRATGSPRLRAPRPWPISQRNRRRGRNLRTVSPW